MPPPPAPRVPFADGPRPSPVRRLHSHTLTRGPGSHATSAGLAGEDLAATLEGLYKVRILMGKAAHEKAALERENAALKAANARLETDTGRMKYQILHLKRNLVAAQGAGA